MSGNAFLITENDLLTILWVYQNRPVSGLLLLALTKISCFSYHFTKLTIQYHLSSWVSIRCKQDTICRNSIPASLLGFADNQILHDRWIWIIQRCTTTSLHTFRIAFNNDLCPSHVMLSIFTPSFIRFSRSSFISAYHSPSVKRYNWVNLMLLSL